MARSLVVGEIPLWQDTRPLRGITGLRTAFCPVSRVLERSDGKHEMQGLFGTEEALNTDASRKTALRLIEEKCTFSDSTSWKTARPHFYELIACFFHENTQRLAGITIVPQRAAQPFRLNSAYHAVQFPGVRRPGLRGDQWRRHKLQIYGHRLGGSKRLSLLAKAGQPLRETQIVSQQIVRVILRAAEPETSSGECEAPAEPDVNIGSAEASPSRKRIDSDHAEYIRSGPHTRSISIYEDWNYLSTIGDSDDDADATLGKIPSARQFFIASQSMQSAPLVSLVRYSVNFDLVHTFCFSLCPHTANLLDYRDMIYPLEFYLAWDSSNHGLLWQAVTPTSFYPLLNRA